MDPYLEYRWRSAFLGISVAATAAMQPRLPAGLRARLQGREPADEGVPREHRFHILDTEDGYRVITAVEILTPAHKALGKLNDRYRRRLDGFAREGVNIVEIDLLRSPRTHLDVTTEMLPRQSRAAYFTCIRRASHPETCHFYPMPLREPLPVIPIPCRAADPDVPLALQPLIERAYTEGGHDDIDYSRPPSPPLGPEDEAWARQLVRAAGRG